MGVEDADWLRRAVTHKYGERLIALYAKRFIEGRKRPAFQ